MSTKIYSGLKVDLRGRSVFEFADEVRAVVSRTVRTRQATDLAQRVATLLDHADHTQAELTEPPLLAAIEQWRDDNRHFAVTASDAPFRFQMQLLAGPDTVLGLVFESSDEYRAAIMEHIDGVTDYAYWDNSDRPDDVSRHEWGARKAAWAEALGPDWTPAKHGISIELGEPTSDLHRQALLGGQPFKDLIAANFPSAAYRAQKIGKETADLIACEPFRNGPNVNGDAILTAILRNADINWRAAVSGLRDLTIDDLLTFRPHGSLTVNEDLIRTKLTELQHSDK